SMSGRRNSTWPACCCRRRGPRKRNSEAAEGILMRRHGLQLLAGLTLMAVTALAWSEPPSNVSAPSASAATSGWSSAAPRDEIRPNFAYQARGGPDGQECFVIKHDQREGLDGCWQKTWPLTGGKHYRFVAHYQATGVSAPRRSVVAELYWG